jgi:hypothetical protein
MSQRRTREESRCAPLLATPPAAGLHTDGTVLFAWSPALIALLTVSSGVTFVVVRACHPTDSLGRVLVVAGLATVVFVLAVTRAW